MLFLTKFTAINATVRYRATQFFPALSEAGFDCVLAPLLPDTYIAQIYGQRSRRRALARMSPQIAAGLLRRWLLLNRVSEYDAVYLQYEALPYFPFAFERKLFESQAGVVVDFVDAVYLNYTQHPNRLVRRFLSGKLSRIVTSSYQVITANNNLAAWAGQFNDSVTIIPNSLDLEQYNAVSQMAGHNTRPVIGWIGTPVTARYLQLLERPFRELRERHEFVLKVIGAPEFRMAGIDVQAVPWGADSEAADLRSCDIGIMPLPQDSWAQGKSALKLIQYLAAGIASVASPVGANRDVLVDGQNGFLAASDREWVDKLGLLIENRGVRERLARAGRQTAEEKFSLQANAPRFVDLIRQATRAGMPTGELSVNFTEEC